MADEAESAIDPAALEKIGRDVKDIKAALSVLQKKIAEGNTPKV